jgi:endonuclease/exonuclease/phosphatase family metal-dependent hydrolase
MTQLHDGHTDVPAAEESLCLARVQLPEGARASTVLVACSVLPWGGAGKWWPGLPEKSLNAQQIFVLEHHMDRIDVAWDREEPIVWGGDFNQELRDLAPERKAAGYRIAGTVAGIERLRAAFDRFGLRALTAESEHLNPEAPTIDHLAVSEQVARGNAVVHRPHYENGTLLSDHAAYTADVEF